MAKNNVKNNVRSFRFSDEVAAVIASQPGKSDNDKFEQLVLTCFTQLPQVEERLSGLQEELISKLQKVRELERLYSEVRSAEAKASNCIMYLDRLSEQLCAISSSLNKL